MSIPFRSEIRNSPTRQTIKVFLNDDSLEQRVKNHLECFPEIEIIEINETVEQNHSDANLTIFLKDVVDINKMKASIDSSLWWYFEKDKLDE